MGSISYDGLTVNVDDRTLVHLQIVIVRKLRRGETFLMSWRDSPDAGSGRSSIWLHPYVLVHFKFDGSKVPPINEKWLAELAASAESSTGLIVTAEQGETAPGLGRTYQRHETLLEPVDGENFTVPRRASTE
jgi:hypothetical protein